MIGGQVIKRTEKEYRALGRDSYSSLALYLKDKRKYFSRYVLGEKEEESDDHPILIGNLVELLLPGMKDDFDKKFYLSICPEAPTANMLKFTNALYKYTELSMEDGVVTVSFDEICKKAYEDSGYKISIEKVVENFKKSGADLYYRQLRESRPKGLQIVCAEDLTSAEKIAEELKTNPNTSWFVNLETDDRYTVYNQFQIDDIEIDGLKLKLMIDRLIIDHQGKKVYILDWKVTWSVEGFEREYYLKRYTYLQGIIYYMGVKLTKFNWGFDINEYYIYPPKFIVADSINYNEPLVYEVTEGALQDAYTGFTKYGKYYPGLEEVIADLQWAKENNKFRISRKNHENKGVCLISEARKLIQ